MLWLSRCLDDATTGLIRRPLLSYVVGRQALSSPSTLACIQPMARLVLSFECDVFFSVSTKSWLTEQSGLQRQEIVCHNSPLQSQGPWHSAPPFLRGCVDGCLLRRYEQPSGLKPNHPYHVFNVHCRTPWQVHVQCFCVLQRQHQRSSELTRGSTPLLCCLTKGSPPPKTHTVLTQPLRHPPSPSSSTMGHPSRSVCCCFVDILRTALTHWAFLFMWPVK